jgi:hypothetical protein
MDVGNGSVVEQALDTAHLKHEANSIELIVSFMNTTKDMQENSSFVTNVIIDGAFA